MWWTRMGRVMSLSALGLISAAISTKAQEKGNVAQIIPKIAKVPAPGNFFSKRQMDINQDGKVTRDEFLIYRDIFRKSKAAKIAAARAKGSSVTPK